MAPPTPFPTLYPQLSSADLGTSTVLYLAVALVLIGIYLCVRQCARYTYYPKSYNPDLEIELVRPPPSGCCAWLFELLGSEFDEKLLREVGLDAYVTVRVLRFGALFFGALTPAVFVFYVPIYAVQENEQISEHPGIGLISLSNVPSELEWIFWFCLLGIYIISFFLMWLLRREYVLQIALRRNYNLDKSESTCTILVERIPDALASKKALRRYFETLVGEVISVELVPGSKLISTLRECVAERDNVLQRLERAKFEDARKAERSKSGVVPKTRHIVFEKADGSENSCLASRACCYGNCCLVCCGGRKVESDSYLTAKLKSLNERIPVLQQHLEAALEERDKDYSSVVESQKGLTPAEKFDFPIVNDKLYSADPALLEEALWLLDGSDHSDLSLLQQSAAFVTFKGNFATTVTARIPLNEVETTMFVNLAKDPTDVIWENVGREKRLKFCISGLVILLDFVLLVGFGVFTSAISASTNLDAIRQGWPALDQVLTEKPWLVVVFDQVAPLLLVIIFALVPPIQGLIIELHKPSSLSTTDLWFYSYYYVFLVVQVFLFYQISGSLYQILFQVYSDPWQALRILAAVVPGNAVFYMQYILLQAFVLAPLELLRVGAILVAFLVRPIFCGRSKTKRERKIATCGCAVLEYPSDPWNAKLLACSMLVFTMGLVYSLMAPLVVPIVAFYAFVTLIVTRNQLKYVYIPVYESGGSFWVPIARSFVFALVLFQLSMMGIFLLNNKAVCTALVIPAIIATIATSRYFDSVYNESMRELPLATAKTFDIMNALQRQKQTGPDDGSSKLSYKHPLLLRRPTENLEEEPSSGESQFEPIQDDAEATEDSLKNA